jgi:hypothetical protein
MPSLYKIQHEYIADTSGDSWYHLDSASAGGGTNFHYRWDYSRGPLGPSTNRTSTEAMPCTGQSRRSPWRGDYQLKAAKIS